MDYTLIITYTSGRTSIQNCATLTDVSNYMHYVLRSQFLPDIAALNVQFTVVNNTV